MNKKILNRLIQLYFRFATIPLLSKYIVTIALALIPMFAFALEKTPIAYTVIAEDKTISQRICNMIETEIKKYNNFELSDNYPAASLFVYAQQDINDRKNPKGWSFAIAHTSNRISQYLAAKLMHSGSKEAKDVMPLLQIALNEPGFLSHINAAHIDEMSNPLLQQAITVIVNNFIEKISEMIPSK